MTVPLVRLPSLDLIKGFVAVGRRMSITQAADDLCLTQSAISKQIRTLEDVLGVSLFNRGFRSVTFTEQGQLLFQIADSSIHQLQNIVALISTPRGRPVTITASTSVASLWLLPRLGEFRTQHPDIDVRFSTTNSILDLGSEVDIAIRYCAEKQAPRGAIRLFGESVAPVASPSLGVSSFKTIETLHSATLLEFDVQGRPWLHWSDWLAARGWSTANAKAIVHFNQYEQMIQAALAGQGIALGRLELLQPQLEQRQLVVLETLSRPHSESVNSFWLVQADGQPTHEVARVAEWVLSIAQQVSQPSASGNA